MEIRTNLYHKTGEICTFNKLKSKAVQSRYISFVQVYPNLCESYLIHKLFHLLT